MLLNDQESYVGKTFTNLKYFYVIQMLFCVYPLSLLLLLNIDLYMINRLVFTLLSAISQQVYPNIQTTFLKSEVASPSHMIGFRVVGQIPSQSPDEIQYARLGFSSNFLVNNASHLLLITLLWVIIILVDWVHGCVSGPKAKGLFNKLRFILQNYLVSFHDNFLFVVVITVTLQIKNFNF